MNKNRLEAFSDGIFAVAITLLVLDVRIPAGVDYKDINDALLLLLPKILSYLLSFLVIGVYWAYHHFSLTRIKKIDGTLLFLNLLTLLLVTFMPFPTILIGEYPFTTTPLVIYGLCLLASNCIGFLWVLHLHQNPQYLKDHYRNEFLKMKTPLYIAVNAPYVVAIALAFFAPKMSYAIYIVVLLGLGVNLWKQMNRAAKIDPSGAPD